jgi:hypothetical protein
MVMGMGREEGANESALCTFASRGKSLDSENQETLAGNRKYQKNRNFDVHAFRFAYLKCGCFLVQLS